MSADFGERYRRERERGERSRFRDEDVDRPRRADEAERRGERDSERPARGDYGPYAERGWRGEQWESPDRWRGDYPPLDRERTSERSRPWHDRDAVTRHRGYGGETGHDTSWSGPSTGTYGQGPYASRGVPGYATDWDRGQWQREGPFAGRGPKGYQRADSRIREDVADRLTDAPDIDASEIEITVNNGEVTLSGTVRDRYQKRRSEDVSEGVPGVRDVHNNLSVSRRQEGSTSGRE
jgi:BON domain